MKNDTYIHTVSYGYHTVTYVTVHVSYEIMAPYIVNNIMNHDSMKP